MNRLIILSVLLLSFSTVVMSQNNDTKMQWKELDKLLQEGKLTSANEQLEKIYVQASATNDYDQMIKALIIQSQTQQSQEEDHIVKDIYRYEKRYNETNDLVLKALFSNIIAKRYNTYLNRNMYQFRNRSQVQNRIEGDILTYSIPDLIHKSNYYFLESIKYKEATQKISNSSLKDILISNKNEDADLYLILCMDLINHFQVSRNLVTEPQNKFILNQEDLLGSIDEFLALTFPEATGEDLNIDNARYTKRVISLYQNLLLEYRDYPGLLSQKINLLRLRFVKQHASLQDVNSKYLLALENYLEKQDDITGKELVGDDLLKAYMTQIGSGFRQEMWPENDQQTLAKLLKLIEIQKNAKESKYREDAKNALLVLQKKEVNVKLEKITPSNQEALCYISYKNVSNLNSRVIKLSYEQMQKVQRLIEKEKFNALEKYESIVEWSNELPKGSDMMNHSIEIMIPPLKADQYLLLSFDGTTPSKSKIVIGTQFIVSDLAYNFESINGQNQIVVVDRTSGEPIPEVKVEFFERSYDHRTRSNVKRLLHNGVTNKNGVYKVEISERIQQQNIDIKLTKGTDVLQEFDSYNYLSYKEKLSSQQEILWFTDRKIYRPGQTIHFKAIALSIDGERMPSLLTQEKVSVKFLDANGQIIEEQTLSTDEYGSLSGTFIIPTGSLNGNFAITVEKPWSYEQIKVEDYKRPKFKPSFEVSTSEHKLGDTIAITALAKSYAGIKLAGAKYKYTVYRQSYYPWYKRFYWCGYNPMPSSGKTFVTQIEGIVDDQGKIDINFKALPDPSMINSATNPNYQFEVQLDVTDIDGETRSASKTLYLGTSEFMVDVEHPTHLPKGQTGEFDIKITNFDGQTLDKEGELVISKVEDFKTNFRKKLWPYPEFNSLDKTSYTRLFPKDLYQIEDHPFQQKGSKEIERLRFKGNGKKVSIPTLPEGLYLVQVFIDGEIQEQSSYIQFFDKHLQGAGDLKILGLKEEYLKDEKASFNLYASHKDAFLFYKIYKQGDLVKSDWSKNGKQITEVIDEDSYGNMHLRSFYVRDNRFYKQEEIIKVPWKHKDLDISYTSFRDNILPGADEEFTITVNSNNKQVNQLTLAMYDASLDEFYKNTWSKYNYPEYGHYMRSNHFSFGVSQGRLMSKYENHYFNGQLSTFFARLLSVENTNWNYGNVMTRGASHGAMKSKRAGGVELQSKDMAAPMAAPMMDTAISEESAEAVSVAEDYDESGNSKPKDDAESKAPPIRKNLNETVFFYPNLVTNEEGELTYSFKMNEAITEWKLMSFAHNKELQFGYDERTLVTKKNLLIQANMPRFLRAGDETLFTAKVSNLTEDSMTGEARIEILNAITEESVLSQLTRDVVRSFTIDQDGSQTVEWSLHIPKDFIMPVIIKVYAISGDHSDGEQNMLSVLTNRKLVTSTKSMMVRPNETKEFQFNHLNDNIDNEQVLSQQYQIEFTTNPVWFAIKAMPYLSVRNNECTTSYADQLFGNGLAKMIIDEHPSIERIFAQWANDPEALKSELEKNEELKEALIAETPWVRHAQSEEQQRRDIALLFDVNKLANEFKSAISILSGRQSVNGGFCWTANGRDNQYTTRYVLEQLLKLKRLTKLENNEVDQMINKGMNYLTKRVKEDFNKWEKTLKKQSGLPYDIVHYSYIHAMYNGSLFGDIGVAAKTYYGSAFKKHWLELSPYGQSMIGLAHMRSDKDELSTLILESLEERAIRNPQLGAYWKNNNAYHWYNLGIEQQALAIEFFEEAKAAPELVDELKMWLLTKKQTTHWPTSKSTTAAIYALVHNDKDKLKTDSKIELWLSDSAQKISNQEAGSGYFNINYDGETIKNEFGTIKVFNPNDQIVWGAAYWQYWDDLDKINSAEENPFTIVKEVFKKLETENGIELKAVTPSDSLVQGDKLMVRVELRSDRDLDYVHMRDMRAAGLEPASTNSQYKYQDGLSYYESTRDRYTDFFFERLTRGTYVFEYELRVTHRGTFSNGITTAQCLYAPSFAGHSEGIKLDFK